MDSIGSFFHLLFNGVVVFISLVLVSLLLGGLYMGFMKQRFRAIKLFIFLALMLTIFFNSYYAEREVGEEIDGYCSRSSNSSSFLLSEDYRNCLLDRGYRGNLIDDQIENEIKELNIARNDGLSRLEGLKTELMAKVNYIGVDKFVEIDSTFPGGLNWRDEHPALPLLVKVTFDDCRYSHYDNSFSCYEQILPFLGERVSGNWSFEANQLTRMKFIQFMSSLGVVIFYLDISTKQDIFSFDFTVTGFEITKENINKNIDSSIQFQTGRLNKFR